MTVEQQRYFDSILDRMPEKPGYEKWVCGSLFHCDPDIHQMFDECPQCHQLFHPETGYKLKDSMGESK